MKIRQAKYSLRGEVEAAEITSIETTDQGFGDVYVKLLDGDEARFRGQEARELLQSGAKVGWVLIDRAVAVPREAFRHVLVQTEDREPAGLAAARTAAD